MVRPADRKEAVLYLEKAYAQSERRCCRVLRLNRGLYRRQPKKDEQAFLRMRIKEIAAVRVCYYMAEVAEENEYRHTCDYDLAIFSVGQKLKFVFDFGDDWRFDCSVLREIAEGTGDEVEIIRSKVDAPSQYGEGTDWNDDTDDEDPEDGGDE